MADGHRAGHGVQNLLTKHLADQTDVLVAADDAAVVDRDARRLLSAVLERKQRDIRLMRGRDLLSRRRGDAEHAALLVHLVKWGFAML